MQAVLDLLPDAVFCVDRHAMILCEVNWAACECLGYMREELRGMGLDRICPSNDAAILAERLDGAPKGEPATAILRTTQRCKDGRAVAADSAAVASDVFVHVGIAAVTPETATDTIGARETVGANAGGIRQAAVAAGSAAAIAFGVIAKHRKLFARTHFAQQSTE